MLTEIKSDDCKEETIVLKKKYKIKDLKIEKNYEHIVHIADLHIPNKIDRKDEYENVFRNLIVNIKKDDSLSKNTTVIIIAGDIFDKARADGMLSPNAITLFKENLVERLKKLGTLIIIPGNHDNNITYQNEYDNSKIDSLNSVLKSNNGENKNVFYLKDTGRYILGNLILYHVSVFDIDKIDKPNEYKERKKILQKVSIIRDKKNNGKKNIGLFHCGIENNRLQNGYILKDCAYKISDLENYDIVCMGDTHEHQFLGGKKNIGYPSSLIQQNYGESIKGHGYIKWKINNNEGEFREIENDYGYILINENDNINEINFPLKSRIKLKYSYDNEINIDELKEKISKKTDIVSWSENRYSIEKNINNEICLKNDINDSEKLLNYIKSEYGEDEEKCIDLHKRLMKDINKHKTDIGRLSCIIKKLLIEDFQCYEGTHEIEFSKYCKNSTISLNGDNASGKSTWLRALDFVIWGAIKGNKESYFNNKLNKKKCKSILEFEYDNQLYKITRELADKGICKHDCKLEHLKNDNWNNLSDKYKQTTQVEINRFFGTREDANATWLRQQDSSNSFINNKTNFCTFQHFIGADIYINIFTESKNNLKTLESELKLLATKKNSFNIEKFSKTMEIDYDKLTKEKENINQKLIQLKENLKNENLKKEYGTIDQKNEWDQLYKNLEIDIKKMSKELMNISKDEYDNQISVINKEIFVLDNEKEDLLKILPKKPKKINDDIETINININKIDYELANINLSKLILSVINDEKIKSVKLAKEIDQNEIKNGSLEYLVIQGDYKKAKELAYQKIELIDNDIIKMNLTMETELDKKKSYQKSQLDIEKLKSKLLDINIDRQEYEQLKKKEINLNQELLKSDTKIENFVKDDSILENLELKKKKIKKEKKIILENVENLDDQLEEYKEKIIDLPKKDVIDKGYNKYLKANENLNDELVNKTNIEKDLVLANKEIEKYKGLSFNEKCECCQKNQNYFKIKDAIEYKKECKQKMDCSLEQIDKLTIKKEKYSNYNDYNNNYQENQINIKNLEIVESKLDNQKNKIVQIDYEISSIKEEIKIYKEKSIIYENKILIENEKEELIKEINTIEKSINKYDEITQKIKEIENLLTHNEYNPENDKINDLENELSILKNVQKLFIEKKSLQENKDAINLMIEYDSISEKIKELKLLIEDLNKKKIELQNNFNSDKEINRTISYNEKELKELSKKLLNFDKYGGFDYQKVENLEIEIENIDNLRDDITKSIGKLEYDIQLYRENKKEIDRLSNDINEKQLEIELQKQYLKIIDPRNGYPNELIKSSLDIFTKRVNEFIRSSGFKYIINITSPEFVEDSKKMSQKMIFSYKKDGKKFAELSGAENFILNIATLSVLGTILNTTTPPLLVIDEGFSCLDKNHLDELPSMLNFIKTKFNYVLYISHDEFIKSKADYSILVKNKRILTL